MIKINERFYINANSKCYVLQEKVTIQDEESKNYGHEVYRDLGYYTDIAGVLNGIYKTKLREFIGKEKENSIEDLLKEMKKIEKELEEFKNI